MQKIIGFIRRRPDHDHAYFSAYWRSTHRDHAMALSPWLKGYVQCHLRPGPLADVQRPADGCPVLWVEHADAIVEMVASAAFRDGAYLDEPRFMEGRSSGLAVTEEVRIAGTGPVKLMLFYGLQPEADQPFPMARASGHVRNHALAGQAIDPACAFAIVDEIWWPDEAAFAADCRTLAAAGPLPGIAPHQFKAARVEELVMIAPPGR